jgi:hypothetical protein
LKKLEIIKLKIENLREIFKFLLIFILSLLTGIVTLAFWVLTKKIEAYFVIFIGIGLFFVFFLVKMTMILWIYMNNLLEELKNDI